MYNENEIDKILNIKTSGRDDSNANLKYFPYEATSYDILERLANSGYILKKNTLVDFGCGKGRVDFYLSYLTKCNSIGIEYDERLYNKAIENKNTFIKKNKVDFINTLAQEYEIKPYEDRFYFFNPFSVDILKLVINNIIKSYNENPREIYLFFYFPSDKYLSFLMSHNNLIFNDEIDCSDLYEDKYLRERILIFEVI